MSNYSKPPSATTSVLRSTVKKAQVLVLKGYPMHWIAQKLGVKLRQVRYWKIKYQWKPAKRIKPKPVPPPPAPRPPSKEALHRLAMQQKQHDREKECDQVRKLLEAGSSQAAVKDVLNLSYYQLNRHLKQLGIATDQRAKAKKRFMAELLYELADQQPEQIDQELALLPGTVAKWIAEYKWVNDQPTATDQLKRKARQLFEVEGMKQKDIAKVVGVSPNTISHWQQKGKWMQPMANVQREARQLYQQGMEQKEIALQCGKSEKTIGNWKKRFQWKRPQQ